MKTLKLATLLWSCALCTLIAADTPSPNPAPDSAPSPAETTPAQPAAATPAPTAQQTASAAAETAQPAPAMPAQPAAATHEPAAMQTAPALTEAAQPTPAPASAATTAASANGTNELRLNFRNAPLDTVLSYLSDAAGFIIDQQTEVKGKVTVWSNQPVTKEEAYELLNSALNRNGYTAIRNGRTLTIYTKDEARKRDIPVKSGNRPEDIPKSDEMVTQIIPVRFINAVQVSRDLQQLLPENATMTANEGGNALIITDSQVSIRRMAEIVRALDTALSSVSAVKVFSLQYADAKAVATVIKDLFTTQETSRTGANAAGGGRFLNQFRGGGAGGMFGGGGGGRGGDGGGGGGGGSSASGGRAPTPRVVAVAEERSNSVVVSAPDEQMPIIEDLVQQIDTSVEDVTELRVFRLQFADAQETADLLTSLFADNSTTSGQGFRGAIQFGGRMGGGFGARAAGASGQESSRMQKQSKVVAVPDLRTSSVVVSAARELMVQIGKMIEELDSDPAKKQQVFVFDVQNTDPQAVQEILESLFPAPLNGNSTSARNSSRNRQQSGVGNQLNNRATQNQNQGRMGNSGFGNFGGSGANGGGFGGR